MLYGAGIELFRLACQLDLEGIVAKRANSPYEDNGGSPHWIKIKNPAYSQKEGRGDLFKRVGKIAKRSLSREVSRV